MATAAAVTPIAEPTGVMYGYIVKVPGYCGGKAALLNRVRVNNVVCMHKEGKTPEEIIQDGYPDLTLAQVHAALAYYYDHVDEIEAELAADERMAELVEQAQAECLRRNATR
jgi:uncharacterized protein (DUF433 family)